MLTNSLNNALDDPRDALWSVGNTYYSNNIQVTDIDNYGCYAHYQYNKLENITGGGSNIVSSSSNTIYFDGSDYNYLDQDPQELSNNIIGSSNIRTSNEENWFYHHDSNNNEISNDIDIPERTYTPSDDYRRYYKCDTDTFLRCASNYDSNPNCGCCSNNQYFNDTDCVNIDNPHTTIENTQLYKVFLGKCLPGYGKSNFDGLNGSDDECIQCTNLVYYDSAVGNDNTCRACPNGKYPNGMDDSNVLNSNCSNAPVLTGLTESNWYRFKYTDTATSTDYYLTYTSNSTEYTIFSKKPSETNTFTYNGSNIYHWSNDSNEVKIQLPTTPNKSGEFLKIQTSLQTGHNEDASLFTVIPYCEPGNYASNLECSPCASNTYSSSYGAERCTECPTNTFTGSQTGKTTCCFNNYKINDDNECVPCSNIPNRPNSIGDGAGDCTPCPEYSTAVDNICLCNSGYYNSENQSDSVSATNCVETTFNNWSGDKTNLQTECPPRAVTYDSGNTSKDNCECEPGYYYSDSDDECKECLVDNYCRGGFLRYADMDICPNMGTTKGQRGQANCWCPDGRWYTSGECRKCTANFYCLESPALLNQYLRFPCPGTDIEASSCPSTPSDSSWADGVCRNPSACGD
jgi:hypothetical protein